MNELEEQSLGAVSREFDGAELGDARLHKRLGRIVDSLAERPDESFPRAMPEQAELEATYRFLRNGDFDHESILQGHFQATVDRIAKEDFVLALHDTTSFEFSGEVPREGLGWLRFNSKTGTGGQGFFGHFALALSGQSMSLPLGVIGFDYFRREGAPVRRHKDRRLRSAGDRESQRWPAMVTQVHSRLPDQTKVTHVMDREADDFALFHRIIEYGQQFVIRVKQNRRLSDSIHSKLYEGLESLSTVHEREVRLSPRKRQPGAKSQKLYPARDGRIAKLKIAATTYCIERPQDCPKTLPKNLQLNFVRVYEIDPPEGDAPIEWRLITNRSIESDEQILEIIDIYRARWNIEDYFKALKTGCAYEKKQLESLPALLKALALLIPIANRLLLLRAMSRCEPLAPVSTVLSPIQTEVLRQMSKKPLPTPLKVKEAMLAIAALGGHIKNNGDPGWQVLGRGFMDLQLMVKVWLVAKDGQEKCDQ